MGNELSGESGKSGNRKAISRTNSLKDISNVGKETSIKGNSETKKLGKPVKRSNTFSGGLSGVRPQITRRSKKKPPAPFENRDAFINEEIDINLANENFNDKNNNNNNNDSKDVKNKNSSNNSLSRKKEEDVLFIPAKKNFGIPETSPTSPKEKHYSTEFTDDSQADSGVERTSLIERRPSEVTTGSQENELTKDETSGSEQEKNKSNDSLNDSEHYCYKKRSRDETNKSESPANDVVDGTTPLKTRSSNVTRIKSSEKRKKVTRSKSMSSTNKYVSVVQESYNSELEDENTAARTAEKNRDSREKKTASGRRTSDSYLLREQHVKRSEQFTKMLKQIREQRAQKSQELSPYALGAIAGRNSPCTPPPKVRQLKQTFYFDSWIKDQSERIENLAKALRGDEYKVHEYVTSLSERGLKSSNWDLLPTRPKSDRLPRRRIHVSRITKYMSSDTEDEAFLQDNFTAKPTSRSHDAEMLRKQLTDTFSLLDNTFKTNKKDFPSRERSSGSSVSSLSYRRISEGAFSDYGTLEEKPDSSTEAEDSSTVNTTDSSSTVN